MNGRHRLVFQLKTEAKDESVGSSDAPTYATAFTVSAIPMSSTSREYFEAQRRNPDMTHLFKIRFHHGGIDPASYRVLYSEDAAASPPNYDVFDLYPPRPDEKRRYMFIELRLSGEEPVNL